MGFNLNTRNTNNLRGSKEIDSIGDDLANISSSLGSVSGFTPTIVWIETQGDSNAFSAQFNFGKNSDVIITSQSAVPGGPNLIVSHSSEGLGGGTSVFCSADGIYEVTADLGIFQFSNNIDKFGVSIDGTNIYEMEARVHSNDDPDRISFTYVGEINSGSKININVEDPQLSIFATMKILQSSTMLVQRIA
jgi:hypothetical protein